MIRNLTTVRGIQCWGAHIGIKSMRRDLAIIYSEVPASAAAVFTKNQVIAEPIKVSQENVANGRAQVIVCNAGNANACTGQQGLDGAWAMVKATAAGLQIPEDHVLVASTGLIGEPFPTEDVVNGIETNIKKLSADPKAGSFAANAILTTDTFAKEGYRDFTLDGKTINMAGIAKGSGMIHPNMGTMLAFVVTDAAISPKLLQQAVRECTDVTFNMITVDGDTSTNDMVAVLANGLAENEEITDAQSTDYQEFKRNLRDMFTHLAKLIVSDGEGASKFVEYRIKGARSEKEARQLARGISDSTLVKAAMFGRDPNWGRIICASGNVGIPFDYTTTDLYIGSREGALQQVLKQGQPVAFDRNALKKKLRESHINVELHLHQGKGEATAWGTDLTTDYVMFNSVYTT